ncbi:polysaccharide deacetylase family protein [Plectosphaerella plurivora]|uniref:Polysaccharide deacetylase family protein n=1 Tax=Plectosphaerella plurivora TaxID=936078 RepID=A0A9P8VHP5_9PEZI|nr:polysaccharide deacetylase family protein [Plectosphaerella plurivora]
MRFGSALCALSTMVATAVASPLDMSLIESRQSSGSASKVPTGINIMKCTVANTIALTFDDGPYIYTEKAIDTLNAAGMKGTFFFNGLNWGNINDYKPTLERMLREKHQIGSHTWNHPYLTQVTKSVARAQMIKVEEHLLKLIGKFPVYMRPPYLDTNAQVLGYLKELDYRVISRDVETNDWQKNPTASIAAFISSVNAGNRLVLAHDVHKETVEVLLPAMIKEIQKRGLKAVTVGTCLGDHSNNWYSSVVRKV